MIKQLYLLFAMALSYATAFAPLATPPPPTVTTVVVQQQQPQQLLQQHQSNPSQQLMNQGIHSFVLNNGDSSGGATSSSSITLSLKERHIPTPEEIAAKKRNFNLWCVPLDQRKGKTNM